MAASKDPTTLGPQTKRYDFRTSLGAAEWGGMIPDGNPASLPDFRTRKCINTRMQGGGFVPRGGQRKLNAAALHAADACIRGLVDFQVGTKKSLRVVGDGCPDISASAGFYFGGYDFEQSPKFQPSVYYNSSTQKVVLGTYGADMLIGNDGELRKFQAIEPPYGQAALAISGSSQDIPLLTPSGATALTAIQEAFGFAFVGCDCGAGASKVITWDGVTERDDYIAINAPTGFGLYRDVIVLGFGGSPNEIRTRPAGSSPGTWTQVLPDAGTATFKQGVSYRDSFYFTTLGENLYRLTGSTLTRLVVGVTGIAAGSITFGIAVHGGNLYVAYTTNGSPTRGRIAKFDGTTWTGTHKDLTSQTSTVRAARALASYRGNLVVGVFDNGTGGGGVLHFSPGTATNGTYTVVSPGAVSNGDIDQILVY